MKNNRIICDTIFICDPPCCFGRFLRVYSEWIEKVFYFIWNFGYCFIIISTINTSTIFNNGLFVFTKNAFVDSTSISSRKFPNSKIITFPPFLNFLFIVLFYRQFRLCITKASGKPIPLRLRASKGSLQEGAVTEGDWGRVRYNKVSTNLKSRGLLPLLTRSPHPLADGISEGGFSLAPLYQKSAEKTSSLPKFYVPAISPLRMQRERCVLFCV